MKRIAFIAHLSELSGSGTSLVETAAAMDRPPFKTWLILPGEGDLINRAREAGIEPVIISNPQTAVTETGPGNKLKVLRARVHYVRNLAKFFRDNEIELACINTSANIFPGIAARMAGVPIVWRIHESLTTKDARTRFKTAVIRRWSSGIVYDSQTGMRNLPHPNGKPGLVARNFIRIDQLKQLGQERLSGNPDKSDQPSNPTIFTNGTIYRKGADILLAAVQLLRQKSPQLTPKVAIAGLPPTEIDFTARLNELSDSPELSGRVTFTGLSSSLAPQLAGADIFVSASRNEALPIAIVEAIAAGVPVIATDVGDCADLLENGRCGWIIPPEDPASLSAALEEAITYPDVARAKAKAAYEKIVSIYGAEDFWQPMQQFMESVMSDR